MEHALLTFSNDKRQQLMTCLPLNLRTDLIFSLIDDESFWKRKCEEEGTSSSYVDFWLSCCSWKKTFISNLVQDVIEDLMAKKTTFKEIAALISPYRHFQSKLTINGFKLSNKELDGNFIGDNSSLIGDVSKLLLLFPNIKEISIFNFPIIGDISSNNIQMNSSMFEEFSKNFSNFAKLSQIVLVGMCLSETYLSCLIEHLAMLSTIEKLDFSCSMINNGSWQPLENLSKMPNLKELKLKKINLTNADTSFLCRILMVSRSLNCFDISGNRIRDEGISSICDSLLKNQVLCALDVSYNNLTPNSVCSLRNVIERNRVLKSLNLSGNNLGEDTGKEISKKIQRNGTLLFLGIQFCGFRKEDEDFIHLCVSCNAKF